MWRKLGSCAALTLTLLTALLSVTATSASAAWTVVGNADGKFLMCKTAKTTGYGRVWEVRLVAASTPGYRVAATFQGWYAGRATGTHRLEARNGAWDVQTAYLSRERADRYRVAWSQTQLSTGQGMGSTLSDPTSPAAIGSC